MRQSRKLDHLKYAIKLGDGPADNRFSDFSLIHNCLPDVNTTNVDLSTTVAGIRLKHPVIFNAITGGAENVTHINRQLAEAARATCSAMAVGSQYAGLELPELQSSYKVVRQVYPDGVLLANIGAHVTPDQALAAIDMIEAQALQIHLNAAQELTMAEGDRNFSGYLRNIERIVSKVPVPVIVKEVGCGIAAEQAAALSQTGIQAIDVGGSGGTNFIAIEAARLNRHINEDLLLWGTPTAISAVEVKSVLPDTMDMIVSGGIRTSLEAVKAIVLGGASIAIATPLLKLLEQQGTNAIIDWFDSFLNEIKAFMLLTGAANIPALKQVPIVITGFSREWLLARGIDILIYARRSKHG